MGLWLTAHSMGIISRFGFSGLYGDFPDIMTAVNADPNEMVFQEARYCLLCGGAFLIISIIDSFSFKFHPLQANVVLDTENRNIERRMYMKNLSFYFSRADEKLYSMFELFNLNKYRYSSYIKVFRSSEL